MRERSARIVGSPDVRFDAKVDRLGPIAANRPDLGRCWLWLAGLTRSGYGTFRLSASEQRRAHRYAWERVNGAVPDGLELDHFACDRRDCCNPAHVRPVTHQENMARGAHARKTHCPAGHPYDEFNTLVTNGRRNCKTCRADWQRRYRARINSPTTHPGSRRVNT